MKQNPQKCVMGYEQPKKDKKSKKRKFLAEKGFFFVPLQLEKL